MTIGIIGEGAIAGYVAAHLAETGAALRAILVRPARLEGAGPQRRTRFRQMRRHIARDRAFADDTDGHGILSFAPEYLKASPVRYRKIG